MRGVHLMSMSCEVVTREHPRGAVGLLAYADGRDRYDETKRQWIEHGMKDAERVIATALFVPPGTPDAWRADAAGHAFTDEDIAADGDGSPRYVAGAARLFNDVEIETTKWLHSHYKSAAARAKFEAGQRVAIWGHVTLHPDLTDEDARAVMAEVAEICFVRHGLAVRGAVHADQANRHFHFLSTPREIDTEEPGKFGSIARFLWRKADYSQWLSDLRREAALAQNRILAERNLDARVEWKSFDDLGVPFKPTGHIGVVGVGMAGRGDVSSRIERNQRVATGNAALMEADPWSVVAATAALKPSFTLRDVEETAQRYSLGDERLVALVMAAVERDRERLVRLDLGGTKEEIYLVPASTVGTLPTAGSVAFLAPTAGASLASSPQVLGPWRVEGRTIRAIASSKAESTVLGRALVCRPESIVDLADALRRRDGARIRIEKGGLSAKQLLAANKVLAETAGIDFQRGEIVVLDGIGRMPRKAVQAIMGRAQRAGASIVFADARPALARSAVDYILAEIATGNAIFTEGNIARAAAKLAGGDADLAAAMVRETLYSGKVLRLVADGRGEARYATVEQIERETRMLNAAAELARSQRHSIDSAEAIRRMREQEERQGWSFNDEQVAAVKDILEGPGINVVIGRPGTGKTTSLKFATDALRAAGRPLRAACLAGVAAANLGAETGIKDCGTIAALIQVMQRREQAQAKLRAGGVQPKEAERLRAYLRETERQDLQEGTVLVVDEAAMAGVDDLSFLITKVQARNGKIVLVGDPAQISSITAGAGIRALADKIGASYLEKVNRQRVEEMARASEAMSRGDFEGGLGVYRDKGCIHLVDGKDAAMDAFAQDYLADLRENPAASRLGVAFLNEEVDALNERIRAGLRALSDEPSHKVRNAQRLIDLAAGDKIVFTRNSTKPAVYNGNRATVTAIEKVGERDYRITAKLDGDGGPVVTWRASEFADWQQGWVVSINRSQGTTVDRVQAFASSRDGRSLINAELGLVMMTRHRWAADLYGDREVYQDFAGLVRAFSLDGAKEMATDFLQDEAHARARRYLEARDAVGAFLKERMKEQALDEEGDELELSEKHQAELKRLSEERKVAAKALADTWEQSRVACRVAGIRHEAVMVHAGLVPRALTERDLDLIEAMDRWQQKAGDARALWDRMVAERGGEAEVWTHPEMERWEDLRDERDRLAAALCRQTKEGKWKAMGDVARLRRNLSDEALIERAKKELVQPVAQWQRRADEVKALWSKIQRDTGGVDIERHPDHPRWQRKIVERDLLAVAVCRDQHSAAKERFDGKVAEVAAELDMPVDEVAAAAPQPRVWAPERQARRALDRDALLEQDARLEEVIAEREAALLGVMDRVASLQKIDLKAVVQQARELADRQRIVRALEADPRILDLARWQQRDRSLRAVWAKSKVTGITVPEATTIEHERRAQDLAAALSAETWAVAAEAGVDLRRLDEAAWRHEVRTLASNLGAEIHDHGTSGNARAATMALRLAEMDDGDALAGKKTVRGIVRSAGLTWGQVLEAAGRTKAKAAPETPKVVEVDWNAELDRFRGLLADHRSAVFDPQRQDEVKALEPVMQALAARIRDRVMTDEALAQRIDAEEHNGRALRHHLQTWGRSSQSIEVGLERRQREY